MFALAMRPRRGGHAGVLGADLTDCAADKAAADIACAGTADTACASTVVTEPLRLRWPTPANQLSSPVSAGAEENAAECDPASFPVEDDRAVEGDGHYVEDGHFVTRSRARKARLAELAEQVRRICRRGTVDLPPCPSGLAALDQALGGGFARGAIHELIAACEGATARSIALLAAARAADQHKSILFIDTAGDFYPPGAAQLGVPLERLVIVRPTSRVDALWACEQALRCPALAAVIMSLARALDTQTSRRLQLAAEAGRSLGLLIYGQNASAQASRASIAGQTFAATRLSLEPLDSRAGSPRAGMTSNESAVSWEGDAPAERRLAGRLAHPSHRAGPRATHPGSARRLQVRILKLREGEPVAPFELELTDPNPALTDASDSSFGQAASGMPDRREDHAPWPPALAV